ncbi:MAG: exodeoxyribonuclease VII large subunit, partial [Prevotella sp.]|nr:exodeoxyribonuclease VII large subunit [Prevotella sp.]
FSSIKSQQDSKLNQMLQFITNGFRLKLKEENNRHIIISQRFNSASKQLMVNEKYRLQLYEKRLELLNPDKLLSRGYSITMKDGKAVTSADELSDGDIIETRLQKGVVKSVVNKGQQ